jgi:hypothetical protein
MTKIFQEINKLNLMYEESDKFVEEEVQKRSRSEKVYENCPESSSQFNKPIVNDIFNERIEQELYKR